MAKKSKIQFEILNSKANDKERKSKADAPYASTKEIFLPIAVLGVCIDFISFQSFVNYLINNTIQAVFCQQKNVHKTIDY